MNFIPFASMFAVVGIGLGLLMIFNAPLLIKIHIQATARWNWRTEPISMEKEILKKYAALQLKIKELEAERDVIKATIIDEFTANNIKKQDTPYGTFTLSARPTYEYSSKVEALVTQTKLLQIEEQEKGIAIKRETPFILFSKKK